MPFDTLIRNLRTKFKNCAQCLTRRNDVSFREAANVATDDATLPQKTSKIMGLLKMGTRLDNKYFQLTQVEQID